MKVKVQVSRFLSLMISYQMIVAPVAMAQETTKPTTNSDDKTFWKKAGDTGKTLIQLGTGAFQAYQGAQTGGNIMTPDLAALRDNLKPSSDKYFNQANLERIPGLLNYMTTMGKNPSLLNCATLPATLNDIKSPVCDPSSPNDPSSDPLRIAYKTTYSDIEKLYSNYSSESNIGGANFGYSCMKDAKAILKGFFDYRAKEMENLVANIEALNKKFKDAAKSDMDNIEESTALLEGGSSVVTSKVKTAKPTLFDFAAQFSDPACSSMFAGNNFKEVGTSKGLKAIQDLVVKAVETPASGKSGAKNFSGDTYLKAHASLVEDIQKMINGVSKQSEINFSAIASNPATMAGLAGTQNSVYGVEKAMSPGLFADIQQSFIEQNQKLQTQLAEVTNEIKSVGGNPDSVTKMMTDLNSGTFDQEVTKIQNGIENNCVKDSVDVKTVVAKMVDPQVSSYGNKNVPSFIKEKIAQIMENKLSSPDKKLQELIALEQQGANKYYVKLDSTYEVQEEVNGTIQRTVVTPATRKTPTAFLADVIKSCKAQFKSNTLETKYSGASAIAKLKELRTSYKSLAQTNAAKIKADLTKRLIDCDSNVVANQENVGSCTSETFNMGSAGFCANSALACSKNMQSCKAKAQKIVTDIKAKRQISINNYKANVEKNKKDLIAIFDTALTAFKMQGTQLGAVFNIPWESPTGIKREITDGSQYNKDLKAIDPSLLIEDPDAYVKLLSDNVKLLKVNIKAQSDDIMGIIDEHINKTIKTYTDNAKLAKQEYNNCDQVDKQIDKNLAEQQKKQAEDMAKFGELCEYSSLNEDPLGACDSIGELSNDALKAASAVGKSDAASVASQLKRTCAQYNKHAEADDTKIASEVNRLCKDKKISGDFCKEDAQETKKYCSSEKEAKEQFFNVFKDEYHKCQKSKDTQDTMIVLKKVKCLFGDFQEVNDDDFSSEFIKKYQSKNCSSNSLSPSAVAAVSQYYATQVSQFGEKMNSYCNAQSNTQDNFKNLMQGLGEKGGNSGATTNLIK